MTEKAGTPNQGGGESFPGFTQEAGEGLASGSTPATADESDIEHKALLPPLPHLDSPLTNRLIKHVSASLRTEGDRSSIRRRFELSLLLERGSSLFDPTPLTAQEEAARQPFASVKLAREPTLAELMLFAETLRGKKVALHASETSAFARHITSYLTAWGMDMRHISTERDDDEYGNEYLGLTGLSASGSTPVEGSNAVPNIYSTLVDQAPPPPSSRTYETSPLASTSESRSSPLLGDPLASSLGDLDAGASFIMIGWSRLLSDLALQPSLLMPPLPFAPADDDIEVLKRRLRQLRAQCMTSMPLRMKSKRPALNSRARSSPHVRQLMTPLTEPAAPAKRGVIIVHFTSLANYSNVRDCIQSILSPGSTGTLPEVIVIPKPVGPRRFLTALHTAVHRPIVDPFFTPIATSPLSPSGQFGTNFGYFPPSSSPTQREADDAPIVRPPQTRTVSSGSNASSSSRHAVTAVGLENGLHLAIPRGGGVGLDLASPVDMAADAARFSQSARSGMLIQSPDGMPMGMFFDPAPRQPGSRRSSTRSEAASSERRRSSTIVRPPTATYTASIEGLLKGSNAGGSSRHSRTTSLVDASSHATPLSRRETMTRRSPASEPQHSPLDRPEAATSPGATRGSRIKPPSAGTMQPGVLTHRPSSGSSGSHRPRTPNTEGVPPLPAATSAVAPPPPLPMSPPRPSPPSHEPADATAQEPVVAAPAKRERKARKPPKDDGVVVPPINVLIVEGASLHLDPDRPLTRLLADAPHLSSPT